ncbi:hypothetical protein ACQJBY_041023 [Aegilops geniculata]
MAPFSYSAFRRTPASLLPTAAQRGLLLPGSPPPATSACATAPQWNAAIRDRLDSGLPAAAVSAFAAMLRAGARPDGFTLPLLNRAAASLAIAGLVGAAHSVGVRTGFALNLYFCNTLVDAYVRHGAVASARQLFDEMTVRDVVSWTSLISASAGTGDRREVSGLVTKMRMDRCEPSTVTLAVLLRLCTAERDVPGGRQLHCYAMKSGLTEEPLVLNSILTHLSRTATGLGDTVRLFELSPGGRDAVSWNIIISEFSSQGNVAQVIDMFERMRREEVCPTCQTLTALVAAFAKHRCLEQGKKLHCFVIRSGLSDPVLVASFLDFYAKCCQMESSAKLFEEFRGTGSCIWSAMMWGLIHHGHFLQVVHLFGRMLNSQLAINADMLQGLVISYMELGASRLGKSAHGYIIRNSHAGTQYENTCYLETSIVKFYARCGNIHLARRCFNNIQQRDIVAWSSMLEAYAIHGNGREALALFDQMLAEGVMPNGVTFLSLLSACSYSGLVSEARALFDCMITKFGITPELGHYTCMVDILGRSGDLDEAAQVISGMNVKPDGIIWGALLASCRTHSNVELASFAAQKLMELEPDNVGYHVVYSNVQAGSGDRWREVEHIRRSMAVMDAQKVPAWSCVADTGSP